MKAYIMQSREGTRGLAMGEPPVRVRSNSVMLSREGTRGLAMGEPPVRVRSNAEWLQNSAKEYASRPRPLKPKNITNGGTPLYVIRNSLHLYLHLS